MYKADTNRRTFQYISFPPRLRYNVSVYHSISETEQYISHRTVATLDNQGAKLTLQKRLIRHTNDVK